MENLCRGMIIGLSAGLVIGGVVVAKNKKLQNKIKSMMSGASEKFEEAKEMLEEKIQEVQQLKDSLTSSNSTETAGDDKEMSKKSKN